MQTTASNGKVPCLAAALRWGADARARTIAATSMAPVPASIRAAPIAMCPRTARTTPTTAWRAKKRL